MIRNYAPFNLNYRIELLGNKKGMTMRKWAEWIKHIKSKGSLIQNEITQRALIMKHFLTLWNIVTVKLKFFKYQIPSSSWEKIYSSNKTFYHFLSDVFQERLQ